jgi:hypothetical protein
MFVPSLSALFLPCSDRGSCGNRGLLGMMHQRGQCPAPVPALSALFRKYACGCGDAQTPGPVFSPARNGMDWRKRAGINPAPYGSWCVPQYVTVFVKWTT